MKSLLATLFLALAPGLVLAQTASVPAKAASGSAKAANNGKAATNGKTPSNGKTAVAAKKKPPQVPDAAVAAVEQTQPMEEPDPSIKLSAEDLEVAKRVHAGEIPCELGAKVRVRPLRREGFFLVSHRFNHFLMHPVESRTGAVRLEDPARGAMWLQLGNKSMLLNQKAGQRLADECQSPEQAAFAENLKKNPAPSLLDPAPAASAARAPASN